MTPDELQAIRQRDARGTELVDDFGFRELVRDRRALLRERDALTAENERLRRLTESMQHVVNCASIFAGLSDMDEIDGEEEHEAIMRLLEAVDGYRTAIAKEPTT